MKISIVLEWETVLEGDLARGVSCLAALRAQIADAGSCETIICFDPAQTTEAPPEKEKWSGPFGGTFTATFAFATDYSYRGISQTQRQVAVQPAFTYETPTVSEKVPLSAYVGAWGSNVYFGNTNPTIAEIDLITSDYARRRYYTTLIDQASLDAKGVLPILAGAGRIASDYERGQVLQHVAVRVKLDEQATTAYVQAMSGMKSDYERRRVLTALLTATGPAVSPAAFQAIDAITSSYDRRASLKARNVPKKRAIRRAFGAAQSAGPPPSRRSR